MFRILKGLLSSTSSLDSTGQSQSAYLEVAVERRGQPAQLRVFANCAKVKDALLMAIEQQRCGAEEKIANPGHWGRVGQIEKAALMDAQACLNAAPVGQTPEALTRHLHESLGQLIDRYRADRADEDGFGLGSLHAVRKALQNHEHSL